MLGFELVGLFGEVFGPLRGGIRLEKMGSQSQVLMLGLIAYVSGSLCLLILEKCEDVRDPGCM